MAERAVLIDAALDRSVPLQHPQVIHEAMRCVRRVNYDRLRP